mgnify:FL=1
MGTKYANCYDETGGDISIAVPSDMTEEQFKERYPEYQLRNWQEYSDRELAEWRLSQIDECDQDLY